MNFPYIEESFISLNECQRLIDFADKNKSLNVSRDDTYSTEIEWIDHGATYYGNNVDPITLNDDEVVTKVTEKCKSLVDCELGYVGIVRWPVGTFMKPHFDSNNIHTPNKVAAMLYLNNNFEGGNLIFENQTVKPEPGKLVIFENTKNLHYVDKVEGSERYALSFWYYSIDK